MELIVFAILLTVTGAQESQLKGPENTLSVVGSSVTLKCLSPSRNCTGVEWLKYSAGSTMTVLNHRGIISIGYIERYRFENKSGCHLIIENVQMTDAGRFICRTVISSNTVEKSAYLIILKNQSKCMTNASEEKTAEGDGVHLTCEVMYNFTNRASMVWKGMNYTPTTVTNGQTISRSDSIVASAPEVPSFTCNTSFSVETNGREIISGLATNIPASTCGTPVVKVMYSVRNVTLSPSLSYYSSGSVITCTAKGRPLPTFKWQEVENDNTWTDIPNQNGNEFAVNYVSSKRYRCVAMNDVRSKSYNATSNEFLVNNASNTMTQLLLILMEYKWVVVGAGVGFLLFVILLIICCCVRTCPVYKCCHSGNKSNDKIRRVKTQDTSISNKANKMQNGPRKARPSWFSTRELPKPPAEVVPPQIMPRTLNRNREEEKQDECISSEVNQMQNAPPKAKPRSVPTHELPKRPPLASPQAISRKDNGKAARADPVPHPNTTGLKEKQKPKTKPKTAAKESDKGGHEET